LRRSRSADGTAPQHTGRIIEFEGWQLDTLKRELVDPTGVIVDLSTGEYDLLQTFLESPQRVLTREYLLDSTRNRTLDVFDRSIDVQVSRLRRKIEATGELIKTIRGAGYLFAAAVRRK
jgi:two-component system, OmpR family, response regulator